MNRSRRVAASLLAAAAALPVVALADGAGGRGARSSGDAARRTALLSVAPDIDPVVLERALVAAQTARRHGFGRRKPFLTVIDYALPSSARRLWVFDLSTQRLLFRERVAHGRGTGAEFAERASNRDGSLASSVGLFVTREVFRGRRGRSLRLIGLEPGFNDAAFRRAIIVHGAPYMSEAYRREHGRFGQSKGCPALDPAVSDAVIDTIAGGSLLFIHLDDPAWLTRSAWLRGERPPRLRARPRLGRPKGSVAKIRPGSRNR